MEEKGPVHHLAMSDVSQSCVKGHLTRSQGGLVICLPSDCLEMTLGCSSFILNGSLIKFVPN